MRKLILGIPILALATGCIVYDNDQGESNDRAHTRPGTVEDSGSSDIEPSLNLSFTPPQAEQGEIFIGSLSVTDGDLNLADVESVQLFGDAEVLATNIRSNEVLLSVGVAADAMSGEADIVVEFKDGSAAWLEAAFVIAPSGQGCAASDYPSEEEKEEAEDDPCP